MFLYVIHNGWTLDFLGKRLPRNDSFILQALSLIGNFEHPYRHISKVLQQDARLGQTSLLLAFQGLKSALQGL